MARPEARNLDRPDETMEFDHGITRWVQLGELTVGRTVLDPGWRWSTHIRPLVGTEWCRSSHVGLHVAGTLHIEFREGGELDLGPGDVFNVPADHDAWVVGEDAVEQIEWSGLRGWLEPLESSRSRVLATIVFTDIVDSTVTAAALGDARWAELLSRHNARVRELASRFGGREVKTTGDGFLVIFDGAARAVRFAVAANAAATADGLLTRAGVHSGEVEILPNDVHGVAVHEAARLLGVAAPGETVLTALTRELVGATTFDFQDRGEHVLKGFDAPRRIYAVVRDAT